MCTKLVSLVSIVFVLIIASTTHGVVIGNWEDGSYDGWIDWGAGEVTIESIGEPK